MASSGGLTDELSKNLGRFIQERTKALLTLRGKKKKMFAEFSLQDSAYRILLPRFTKELWKSERTTVLVVTLLQRKPLIKP